jgi:hypothetical protein
MVTLYHRLVPNMYYVPLSIRFPSKRHAGSVAMPKGLRGLCIQKTGPTHLLEVLRCECFAQSLSANDE